MSPRKVVVRAPSRRKSRSETSPTWSSRSLHSTDLVQGDPPPRSASRDSTPSKAYREDKGRGEVGTGLRRRSRPRVSSASDKFRESTPTPTETGWSTVKEESRVEEGFGLFSCTFTVNHFCRQEDPSSGVTHTTPPAPRPYSDLGGEGK